MLLEDVAEQGQARIPAHALPSLELTPCIEHMHVCNAEFSLTDQMSPRSNLYSLAGVIITTFARPKL